MPDTVTIVVTGMHRSGTSALAGTLVQMGGVAGRDEELMPAKADNPKGFFERNDVFELHEEILEQIGASWHLPPHAVGDSSDGPIPWDELVRDYGPRVRSILDSFGEDPVQVLKDPRFCLLLPLWKPFLGSCILLNSIRCPWSVAQSLQRRNEIPVAVGLALWEAYEVQLLQHLDDVAVYAVEYEQLISSPDVQMKRLLQLIHQRSPAAADQLSVDQPGPFASPDLDHSERGDEGAEWPGVTKLHQQMCDAAASEDPLRSSKAHQLSSVSSYLLNDWSERQQQFAAEADLLGARAALEAMREQVQDKTTHVQKLEAHLRHQRSDLDRERAHVESFREALRQEKDQGSRRLAEVGQRLTEVTEARTEALERLQTSEERLLQLEQVRKELERNSQDLAKAKCELERRLQAADLALDRALATVKQYEASRPVRWTKAINRLVGRVGE